MKDNVKISDLVAHGLLKPGDEALYRDTQLVCIKVETNKQKARINENNEMEWFEGDQKVVHQTPTAFAKYCNGGKSVSGWQYLTVNGQTLFALRAKYWEMTKPAVQPIPETETIEVLTPPRKIRKTAKAEEYMQDESEYVESEIDQDDDFLISDEDVKPSRTRATPTRSTSTPKRSTSTTPKRSASKKKPSTPSSSKKEKPITKAPKLRPYKNVYIIRTSFQRKFTSGNVQYVDEDIVSTRVRNTNTSLIDDALSINNTFIQL